MDADLVEKRLYVTHKGDFPLTKTHEDVHQAIHQVWASDEQIIE